MVKESKRFQYFCLNLLPWPVPLHSSLPQTARLLGKLRRVRDGQLLLVQGLHNPLVPAEQVGVVVVVMGVVEEEEVLVVEVQALPQGLAVARELQEQGVMFRQQVYPGEVEEEHHLATLTSFLHSCLHL